jgi:hypothetical protein
MDDDVSSDQHIWKVDGQDDMKVDGQDDMKVDGQTYLMSVDRTI